MYKIEKYVDRLINGEPTDFLNPIDLINLKGKLNKNQYKIYKPTLDSEKVILYNKKEPNISLYEIITNNTRRHQEILGSLFNLNFSFGLVHLECVLLCKVTVLQFSILMCI